MEENLADEFTFSEERFTDALAEEIYPLAELHNKEIGGVIQDISARVPIELYKNLDKFGILKIFCLRKNCKLFGYNILASMIHPKCNVLCAQHDSLYLHPSARVGFNAIKFLKWCDELLKNAGIVFVTQTVTHQKDFSPLLKRIGYKSHETIYIKKLN